MAEYAEWCIRCDCWPSQRCRCELHPTRVHPLYFDGGEMPPVPPPTCLAHLLPEPCPACAAYIAAGL